MKKQQKQKDKGLAVRREVVFFLGSSTVVVGGVPIWLTTVTPCTPDSDPGCGCTCTQCTGSGCTNSATVSIERTSPTAKSSMMLHVPFVNIQQPRL